MVDAGEEIGEAVVREVFEETGIKAEYRGILGFTEMKKVKFGLNDLYFLCLLRPTSFEINKCEDEIEEAKWEDVDTFVQSESLMPFFTKLKQMVWYVDQAQKNGEDFAFLDLIKDVPKEELVLLESFKYEFNLGKKGREKVYNLNYPVFSRNFNKPKL